MGQEIYKVSLENLVVPISKEVLKKNPHDIRRYSKGIQKSIERAPWGQNWFRLKNKIK